ncbi:DUF3140 domain-containing protein [Phenylobacterium sp.]|uniref:DUF3140 domain-containing protein n=1 Tax=Phenylobacterium sp. TaxID=1871053 RepID=UPI002F94A774
MAQAFAVAVNMSAAELIVWLDTDESRRVGWKGADASLRESVGHASGRRIAEILAKSGRDLTEADYALMRKATGFIRRHTAQAPANMLTSRWRYSLMNWGHDPLKRFLTGDREER